ncbi:MAG: YkgJ family cysteine cluster protein [Myxococcota bacterium]|nr:YkgJ family cysteine cluster protein [Myxococcota bacterium]
MTKLPDAPTALSAAQAPAWVRALHDAVDRRAGPIASAHAGRLACGRGCSSCCQDDLTVYEVEALRIEAEFSDLLATSMAAPRGACAFLDDTGACRIYAARPYVCRTQGLPLRWLEEAEDWEFTERRDICHLNADGPALGDLPAEEVWEVGPVEDRLAYAQEALDGGALRRVTLRSLFRRT